MNPAPPPPPPGWYADPSDPTKRLYWDGQAWVGPAGPAGSGSTGRGRRTASNFGSIVLVAIGLVMSMQSVSLLTGSGPIWTGVAVIAAGTALAFVLRASVAVRILAVLALLLGVGIALTVEDQMSTKREELTRLFDQ